MRTELPELKRACFWFPLRYSLILWGYGSLVCIMIDLYTHIMFLAGFKPINSHGNIYYAYFCSTMILIDFILAIIFIIGAHKKNVKLLKIFYFYDLSLLIVQTGFTVGIIIYCLYGTYLLYQVSADVKLYPSSTTWKLLVHVSYLVAYLIIKGYVLVLVRNEINKLQNNYPFSFVNKTAEGECTMKYIKTDEEFGIEDRCVVTCEPKNTCNNENTCNKNLENLANKCMMKYKKIEDEESDTSSKKSFILNKSDTTCDFKDDSGKNLVKFAIKTERMKKYKKMEDEEEKEIENK